MLKIGKAKIITCIVALFFLLLMFWPTLSSAYGLSNGDVEGIDPYFEGWYIIEDGRKIEIELPFDGNGRVGEETLFYHEITAEEWGKWLSFFNMNSFLSVYADDELIYEGQVMSSAKRDRIPISTYNYIEIPSETRQLVVKVSSPFRGYGDTLHRVYIADTEALLVYMNQNMYYFNEFVDMVLSLVGALLIVCGIYYICVGEKGKLLLYLGATVFCMGRWMRFATVNVEIRHFTGEQVELLSWFFWFLLPIFLELFLSEYFFSKKRKHRNMAMIYTFQAVVSTGTVVFGIFDFLEIAIVSYILVIISIGVLIYDVLCAYSGDKLSGHTVGFRGFLMLLLLGCAEMLQYYFTKMPTGCTIRFGFLVCVVFIGVEELHNRTLEKTLALENEAKEQERQLKAILSRLQPKFIFDSLGTIQSLVQTDSEAASGMVKNFSEFMRIDIQALRQKELIPFSQELEQIKAYMSLEEMRLKQQVRAEYEIETTEFRIPPLTVEPLVVNAVNNVLKKNTGIGVVKVRTHKQGDIIILEVSDNGLGFEMDIWSEEQLENSSCNVEYGMDAGDDYYMSVANVCNRLKSLAGVNVLIDSEPGQGTTIHIEVK